MGLLSVSGESRLNCRNQLLALRTLSARRRCVGPMNPLLGKEGARGRLLMRHCITSPDPSLVRRGTFNDVFIGRRGHEPPFIGYNGGAPAARPSICSTRAIIVSTGSLS